MEKNSQNLIIIDKLGGPCTMLEVRGIRYTLLYSMYLDSPKWEWWAMAVSAPATVCTAVSPRWSTGSSSLPREPRIPTVIKKFQSNKVTCWINIVIHCTKGQRQDTPEIRSFFTISFNIILYSKIWRKYKNPSPRLNWSLNPTGCLLAYSQPCPNSILPFNFPFKSFGIFLKPMILHCWIKF